MGQLASTRTAMVSDKERYRPSEEIVNNEYTRHCDLQFCQAPQQTKADASSFGVHNGAR